MSTPGTPTLTTERLLLVPLTLADAPDIQRHFPRWEVVQHLSDRVPWPYPADGALSFVRDVCLPAMARGERLIWALRLRAVPEETVGVLEYIARDDGFGHRGFWLAAHLHGQGLMTEAVIAFQDYLLLVRGVPRIVVVNAANNPASRRVKEKTGGVFLDNVDLPHLDGTRAAERWLVTATGWASLRGAEPQA